MSNTSAIIGNNHVQDSARDAVHWLHTILMTVNAAQVSHAVSTIYEYTVWAAPQCTPSQWALMIQQSLLNFIKSTILCVT